MEWSPACGLLGIPIVLSGSSQPDGLGCTVTQLFNKVMIEIPTGLLLCWGINEEYGDLDADFTSNKARFRNVDGTIYLEAVPWETLAPEGCRWHFTEDQSVMITLHKAPSNLGSWPFSLQSLSLRCSSGSDTNSSSSMQHACLYDKAAFNERSDELLEAQLAAAKALKAAFASAISEQMGTLPCGTLGQSAFVFPQPGPHCMQYIHTIKDLPLVRKLIRIALDQSKVSLLDKVYLEPGTRISPLVSLVSCLVAGLAAVERYREDHGMQGIKAITACVGLGAGEYAAAVFAGALRLQDAIAAIRVQAAALEEAALGYEDNEYDTVDGSFDAVRDAMATFVLKDPRIVLYSGAMGTVIENATVLASALPWGVCAGPADTEHKKSLKTGLEQQGVAEMSVLVPEEDAMQRLSDGKESSGSADTTTNIEDDRQPSSSSEQD